MPAQPLDNTKIHEEWNAYKDLGASLSRSQQFQAAIDAFNKSLALHEHWNTYQDLGWALFHTQQFQAAIDAFNKSLAHHEDWNTYKGLGSTHFHTKQYQAAIDAFNKSLALHEHWNTYQGLGWALFHTQQYQAAIYAFNKSLALHEHWHTYQGLGWALFNTQQYRAANDAFNKSLEIYEHWYTYQGLGATLFHTQQYRAAIDAFNKSLEIHETWDTYQGLGATLFHTQQYRAALDAIYSWDFIENSRDAADAFFRVFMKSNECKDRDRLITGFFENALQGKRNDAILLLSRYVINKCNTMRIDPLLIRQASLILKKRDKEGVILNHDALLKKIESSKTSNEERSGTLTCTQKYVFGISHASLHIGSPRTKVVRCSAGTMFSIGKSDSRTKHYQKIVSVVETLNPKNSCLVFEFGEVDLRKHIMKVSKRKCKNPYSIIESSITNYIDFISLFKQKGFKIVISAPHCGGGCISSRYSEVERNNLCSYLNDRLAQECDKKGFYFCTLFDVAVDQKSLKQVSGLFKDNHHFHMPPHQLGIALNTLACTRVNTAPYNCLALHQDFHKEEITTDCRVIVSNIPNWESGSLFAPGEINMIDATGSLDGLYMLLIELPFSIHPKEVILTFQWSASAINTAIQAVQESSDLSKELTTDNVINAYRKAPESPDGNSLKHLFDKGSQDQDMCRHIIIRLSSNIPNNCLVSIGINRWTYRREHAISE